MDLMLRCARDWADSQVRKELGYGTVGPVRMSAQCQKNILFLKKSQKF